MTHFVTQAQKLEKNYHGKKSPDTLVMTAD